jgi:hypothetical protein
MPEIRIAISDQGQLGVNVSNDIAPNMALVLGLLELGKHAWLERAKQQEQRVQPVTLMPGVR